MQKISFSEKIPTIKVIVTLSVHPSCLSMIPTKYCTRDIFWILPCNPTAAVSSKCWYDLLNTNGDTSYTVAVITDKNAGQFSCR